MILLKSYDNFILNLTGCDYVNESGTFVAKY